MAEYKWEKPVLTFYRADVPKGENQPFAVVQATELQITKKDDGLHGEIRDFFPLMGQIGHISTEEGKVRQYIMCWQDLGSEDFKKGFRRIADVSFPEGLNLAVNEHGKKTYNATFQAQHGKLE